MSGNNFESSKIVKNYDENATPLQQMILSIQLVAMHLVQLGIISDKRGLFFFFTPKKDVRAD